MKDGQAVRSNAESEFSSCRSFLNDDSFSRLDDSDDLIFYETDRFVQHLDSLGYQL